MVIRTAVALVVFSIAWPAPNAMGDASRDATVAVAKAQWPRFDDDLDFFNLAATVRHQLDAPASDRAIVLGGRTYPAARLRQSATRLGELARRAERCIEVRPVAQHPSCRDAFEAALRAEFTLYTTRQHARFTAYYTPTIDVATRPNAHFRYPLYAPPPPAMRRATRRDIDFRNVLAGRGLELFYARDRFDIFLLHVEGGGRLSVVDRHNNPNAHFTYVSYAADNGQPFHDLAEYMLRRGMLRPGDTSRFAQRQYLRAHPEDAEEIYASSPGYVFYRESETPPLGGGGVPLMPNRALASDPSFYPAKELIAFVVAPVPLPPWSGGPLDANPGELRYRELRRFFVNQDEGHSIKGPARFDLYFGEDDYAAFLANNFRAQGAVYFPVLE
jgi:membrane-bound lytic murein transglycosylase A